MTTWWRPFGKSAPPLLYVANRKSDLPLGALNAQVWGASASPDVSVPLVGQQFVAQQGVLSAAISVALNGHGVTAQFGTLSPAAGVASALAGQQVGSVTGALSPAISVALVSQSLGAQQGTLTPSVGASAQITGQQVSVSRGTLGVSVSVPLVGLALSAQQGVVALSNDVTVPLVGLSVGAQQGVLIADGGQQEPSGDGGGGYEISAERWNKTIPEFLRRRYEKETPQAQTAKRIARALNKASIEKVSQQAREGGVEAVTLSHTLYFSYIAHLLRSWDVPSLNGLSAALLTQIAEASNQRQMIQAAQALLTEIDEQDEELLLTSII